MRRNSSTSKIVESAVCDNVEEDVCYNRTSSENVHETQVWVTSHMNEAPHKRFMIII